MGCRNRSRTSGNSARVRCGSPCVHRTEEVMPKHQPEVCSHPYLKDGCPWCEVVLEAAVRPYTAAEIRTVEKLTAEAEGRAQR